MGPDAHLASSLCLHPEASQPACSSASNFQHPPCPTPLSHLTHLTGSKQAALIRAEALHTYQPDPLPDYPAHLGVIISDSAETEVGDGQFNHLGWGLTLEAMVMQAPTPSLPQPFFLQITAPAARASATTAPRRTRLQRFPQWGQWSEEVSLGGEGEVRGPDSPASAMTIL